MRLASLTLQGFKSFGNRTTIEFATGVTAIIGPNGSGKSNVIDALKWTSGGGRAREFRAADKTDLIFHGAAGKRSVGLAEVEVELESEAGSLKVYRSLDREGTTRLRLNGRAARFMDVEEALAGSGLGRSGLAIIGQGEVSQVLIADPAKLLEYVAEAAGVARLSSRRDQTQARLETALSHLERLQDVLVELERRCEALAEEARDATRHADLTGEGLTLRFTAASVKRATLVAEIKALEEQRGVLEGNILDGRETLAGLRDSARTANQRRDAAEESYRKASAELEFRRGNLRLAAERLERLTERRTAHEATIAARTLEAERLEQLEPPRSPDQEPADAEQASLVAQAAADAARTTLLQRVEQESAALQTLQVARTALADAELAATSRGSKRESIGAQLTEVDARLATLGSDDAETDLQALNDRVRNAALASDAAEAALEEARGHLQELHEQYALASAESVARQRAADRLRAAFEARRGYAQGPRNALAANLPGVIGSVADLVRVEPKYQEAIAGALGRRAEFVVVEDAETGERVIHHVRAAGGFVTVMPLDMVRPQQHRPLGAFANQAGVLAAATDVITVDQRFADLFEQLLGGTAVVADLRTATTLARRHSQRPRLVTLTGDTFESTGAMSGGKRSQQASVLGAAADLEEAELAAAESVQAAEAAGAALAGLQAEVREQLAAAKEFADARAALESRLAEAREALAGRTSLVADLEARKSNLAHELAELEAEEAPDEGALQALRQRLEDAENDHGNAARALETAREQESEARMSAASTRQHASMAAERWRAYVSARSSYQASKARAADLREELAALRLRSDELARERTEAAAAHELANSALPNGLEAEERELAAARAQLKELEAALAAESEAQADRAQALEETKVQAARRDSALEIAEDDLRAFPPGLEALDLTERAAKTRLRAVEEELEQLGLVNHRATADLQETRDRKEGLEVEAVQATLAVAELESALEKIDRETTLRLGAAIARLKDAFSRHVRQLFGADGRGGIEVESEGTRPVGLRIRLQPPGKQTHSLHLLSVGERTMGALAFLFALMGDEDNGGGLPVAVLDEVDAPLDEANIRRFGAFVSRLAAAGTQFILITHQKATFEVAETLWGVTTEQGVSRVFSIRREDAEQQDLVGSTP